MEAIIKKCTNCGDSTGPAATFQNGKYGQGNRVFCPSQKKKLSQSVQFALPGANNQKP